MKTQLASILPGTQSRTMPRAPGADNTPAHSQQTLADSRINLNEPDMPRVLGDYELESLIAPGGMGMVYKAHHRTTGASVALKTLRRDFLTTPDMMMRFRREVQAGELHHPNIMPVLDAGESDGRPFLIMPLAFDSLGRQMDRFREPKAAARLMAQVARGVDAAHRRGVVHRDLKPANILLDDSEAPKVADFGLAKIIDDLDTMSLTVTGAVLGTPPYMAPEQAFGAKTDVGAGVDVWALGIILYELITKQRPFDGQSREATLERVRHIDPPLPRQWKPDLDRQLETIILTCLEKDSKHRYPSAGALADDLDAWLAGQSIKARRRWWAPWLKPIQTSWKTWAPAAVGVALLMATVIGLASAMSTKIDAPSSVASDDQLENLKQEVATGNPVSLIVPGHMPRWHQWHPVNAAGTRLRQVGGVTVAESPSVVVLQLFKSAPRYYRIEAELRIREVAPVSGSGFGVAFGHRVVYAKEGRHDGMFSFRDIPPREPRNVTRMYIDYALHTAAQRPRATAVMRDSTFPKSADTGRNKYTVEVTPAGIKGTRNFDSPLELDWVRAGKALGMAFGRGNAPVEFATIDTTGGIGLVLHHSAVEIHSFTLTSLVDSK